MIFKCIIHKIWNIVNNGQQFNEDGVDIVDISSI